MPSFLLLTFITFVLKKIKNAFLDESKPNHFLLFLTYLDDIQKHMG